MKLIAKHLRHSFELYALFFRYHRCCDAMREMWESPKARKFWEIPTVFVKTPLQNWSNSNAWLPSVHSVLLFTQSSPHAPTLSVSPRRPSLPLSSRSPVQSPPDPVSPGPPSLPLDPVSPFFHDLTPSPPVSPFSDWFWPILGKVLPSKCPFSEPAALLNAQFLFK